MTNVLNTEPVVDTCIYNLYEEIHIRNIAYTS